jgi:hypothetical protein
MTLLYGDIMFCVCTLSRLLQVIAFELVVFTPKIVTLVLVLFYLGMARPHQLVSLFIELHRVIARISIWTSVLSDFGHLMVSPLKLRI